MTTFSLPDSLPIFIGCFVVFIFTNLVYPSPSNCVSECHFFFQLVHIFFTSFEDVQVRKIHHSAWWQLFWVFFSNIRALFPDNRSIECNSMFSFFPPKQQNHSQSPWKSGQVRDIYDQCMIISTPMQCTYHSCFILHRSLRCHDMITMPTTITYDQLVLNHTGISYFIISF